MKRNYLLILAAASIAFASCQNKDVAEPVDPSDDAFIYSVEKTFHGSTDFRSKTVLNYQSVLWESTDAVKILWGEGLYNKAVARPFNAGASAELTTTVEAAESYYGVYPYEAISGLSGGVLSVTVPAAQSGDFADACILVSKADDADNMTFRHVVSFLEFTIDRTGILTFRDGVSDKIAGVVKVSGFAQDGTPVYDVVAQDSEIAVDIKSSGTYYVALLPDVRIDVLSIVLEDGGSEEYLLSANPIQMAPGKLVALGNITDKFRDTQMVGATLESFTITEFDFDSYTESSNF